MHESETRNPKTSGSLPAPPSGHATTIIEFFCSFTHLWKPRSPPKFKFLSFTTPDSSIEFQYNPFITFWVMLVMPRSHWAFLALPMQSRWKLTSIRRCSGGIIEPSPNNLNSWYSWESISPMPKIFNACFEIFREPSTMFCREKCSANIRRWSVTNRGIFAEHSQIFFKSEMHRQYRRSICETSEIIRPYTPSQRGNYHHNMFHNPTAAVNLFHVGKQYLTLCKAKAAVTRNLIGRKIISNVKHEDSRNSLPILDVIRSNHKRHSVSEYCK